MSHTDVGPLATYNSLTDRHLTGYFCNPRKRRHLLKAGLVTRHGNIVSENTYRLSMAKKEHKKYVKDMLAHAIVRKSLDLERQRQSEIRGKIEEIAKIELVRRVKSGNMVHEYNGAVSWAESSTEDEKQDYIPVSRAPFSTTPDIFCQSQVAHLSSRERRPDADILPLLSPHPTYNHPTHPSRGSHSSRSSISSDPSTSKTSSDSHGQRKRIKSHDHYEGHRLSESGDPPVYLSGTTMTTPRQREYIELDSRHLANLDSVALQKYASEVTQHEYGYGVISPYLMPQLSAPIPAPPKTPRPHTLLSRSYPNSARTQRNQSLFIDKKTDANAVKGSLMIHRPEPAMMNQEKVQSMATVTMKYLGRSLVLPRDQMDPTQHIVIEQQHCGGNTLPVFKEKILPGSTFKFISRRHRGYPFSLSMYIDSVLDCRVSACCEFKHAAGTKLGGKAGHFILVAVKGSDPCFRCRVEKEMRDKKKKKEKREREAEKKRRALLNDEIVTAVGEREEPPPPKDDSEDEMEKIIVPVEESDAEESHHATDSQNAIVEVSHDEKYDDEDFEDSNDETSTNRDESERASESGGRASVVSESGRSTRMSEHSGRSTELSEREIDTVPKMMAARDEESDLESESEAPTTYKDDFDSESDANSSNSDNQSYNPHGYSTYKGRIIYPSTDEEEEEVFVHKNKKSHKVLPKIETKIENTKVKTKNVVELESPRGKHSDKKVVREEKIKKSKDKGSNESLKDKGKEREDKDKDKEKVSHKDKGKVQEDKQRDKEKESFKDKGNEREDKEKEKESRKDKGKGKGKRSDKDRKEKMKNHENDVETKNEREKGQKDIKQKQSSIESGMTIDLNKQESIDRDNKTEEDITLEENKDTFHVKDDQENDVGEFKEGRNGEKTVGQVGESRETEKPEEKQQISNEEDIYDDDGSESLNTTLNDRSTLDRSYESSLNTTDTDHTFNTTDTDHTFNQTDRSTSPTKTKLIVPEIIVDRGDTVSLSSLDDDAAGTVENFIEPGVIEPIDSSTERGHKKDEHVSVSEPIDCTTEHGEHRDDFISSELIDKSSTEHENGKKDLGSNEKERNDKANFNGKSSTEQENGKIDLASDEKERNDRGNFNSNHRDHSDSIINNRQINDNKEMKGYDQDSPSIDNQKKREEGKGYGSDSAVDYNTKMKEEIEGFGRERSNSFDDYKNTKEGIYDDKEKTEGKEWQWNRSNNLGSLDDDQNEENDHTKKEEKEWYWNSSNKKEDLENGDFKNGQNEERKHEDIEINDKIKDNVDKNSYEHDKIDEKKNEKEIKNPKDDICSHDEKPTNLSNLSLETDDTSTYETETETGTFDATFSEYEESTSVRTENTEENKTDDDYKDDDINDVYEYNSKNFMRDEQKLTKEESRTERNYDDKPRSKNKNDDKYTEKEQEHKDNNVITDKDITDKDITYIDKTDKEYTKNTESKQKSTINNSRDNKAQISDYEKLINIKRLEEKLADEAELSESQDSVSDLDPRNSAVLDNKYDTTDIVKSEIRRSVDSLDSSNSSLNRLCDGIVDDAINRSLETLSQSFSETPR